MARSDLVRTGISGLDVILSDGIPRGNIILVEGAVGTGKTTLGVEFVYRGVSEFGEPGLIVLFEVSPEKLARDASQFGWDLAALERKGTLRILFTTRQVFRQELQQADSLLSMKRPRWGPGASSWTALQASSAATNRMNPGRRFMSWSRACSANN